MNKILKIFMIATLLTFTVSGSVFAAQCDSNYSYRNGHRAVHSSHFLSRSVAQNVKICAESDVPSLWKTATQNAINSLNSSLSGTNSHLRFSYRTSGCTFKVEMSYSLQSIRYAEINEPVIPGYTAVMINGNLENIEGLLLMEHIMMHELLHTVGLGHTGTSSWYEVPGTDGYYDTKYAGRSLMCEIADDGEIYPQRHLNFLDKRALEIIYPK